MHSHLLFTFLLRTVKRYIQYNFVTGTRSHRLISSATLQLVLLDVVIAVYLMKTLIPVHRHRTPLPKEHLLKNTEVVRYVSVFSVIPGYFPVCIPRLLMSEDQALKISRHCYRFIGFKSAESPRSQRQSIIFNLTGDEYSSVYESVT